jgi:hypothetical protein
MQYSCSRFLILICLLTSFLAWGQTAPKNGGDFSDVTNPDPATVVPKDKLIVKGAWYSASDSVTPVPEGGNVSNNVFSDPYFRITYPLPANWTQKYTGPPPSDTGFYVLAQLRPMDAFKDKINGHMEIFAQDMFFSPIPAKNALQMINNAQSHLLEGYQVEMKPTETKIGGQSATFFAYWSPAALLHWYVLATEIRCHTVRIQMTSQDTKVLDSLVQDLNKMKLPSEASPTGGQGGGDVPVCIKDYANSDNVIERVDPVFPVRRFNTIPVRIIIDKDGKVKHIHILRAFPDQEKEIYSSLKQWKFRPYERNGERMEVETGIIFGARPRPVTVANDDSATD